MEEQVSLICRLEPGSQPVLWNVLQRERDTKVVQTNELHTWTGMFGTRIPPTPHRKKFRGGSTPKQLRSFGWAAPPPAKLRPGGGWGVDVPSILAQFQCLCFCGVGFCTEI